MSDYSSNVHNFMLTTNALTDAKRIALHNLITHANNKYSSEKNASFALESACSYLQPEIAAVLIDDYDANVNRATSLVGHGTKKATFNLLHDAINSYEISPYLSRTPELRQRLTATIELLLQKGVNPAPNPDPRDNPVHEAAQIAYPQFFLNDTSELPFAIVYNFDPADDFVSVKEPYELMRRYAPRAVADYEAANPKVKIAARKPYQTLFAQAAANENDDLDPLLGLFNFQPAVLRTEFGTKASGVSLWELAADKIATQVHKIAPGVFKL